VSSYKAELVSFLGTFEEDCKRIKLIFQTRFDGQKQISFEGVDSIQRFEHPKESPLKKAVFQNIPMLKEKSEVTIWGEGENNTVALGNILVSGADVRIKDIEKTPVAILTTEMKGLVMSEELVSFIRHNLGQTVTLDIQPCQQTLFDEATAQEDVPPDNVKKLKAAKG
jgi:hypothetical protein